MSNYLEPCRKKGYRRRLNDTLPFPNYALKPDELPIICRATLDTDTGIFSVVNRIDMLTLYQNGVFGVSNVTNRGPSNFTIPRPPPRQFRDVQPKYPIPSEIEPHQEGEGSKNVQGAQANGNGYIYEEIREKLILEPEEVMFLSFGVGCLSILDQNGQALNYLQVWEDCIKRNPDFPIIYAVYHYFRAKNWVPKDGSKFGGDYVLYRDGPEINHSSFVVHIMGLPSRPIPSWTSIHSWSRVCVNAKKRLLVCFATTPKDFKPDHPRSIFSIKIKEVVLSRWKPLNSDDTDEL